jgi:two-component system LytT family response regulator
VFYFRSEDCIAALYTATERFTMEPALAELEQRLDPAEFFRISRTALVRLDSVAEVVPTVGGCGEVILKNGRHLEVSRRRFPELLEVLRGG